LGALKTPECFPILFARILQPRLDDRSNDGIDDGAHVSHAIQKFNLHLCTLGDDGLILLGVERFVGRPGDNEEGLRDGAAAA